MEREQITIRLPKELIEQLRQEADRKGISLMLLCYNLLIKVISIYIDNAIFTFVFFHIAFKNMYSFLIIRAIILISQVFKF